MSNKTSTPAAAPSAPPRGPRAAPQRPQVNTTRPGGKRAAPAPSTRNTTISSTRTVTRPDSSPRVTWEQPSDVQAFHSDPDTSTSQCTTATKVKRWTTCGDILSLQNCTEHKKHWSTIVGIILNDQTQNYYCASVLLSLPLSLSLSPSPSLSPLAFSGASHPAQYVYLCRQLFSRRGTPQRVPVLLQWHLHWGWGKWGMRGGVSERRTGRHSRFESNWKTKC